MGRIINTRYPPLNSSARSETKDVYKLGRIRKYSMVFSPKTTWTYRHIFGTLPPQIHRYIFSFTLILMFRFSGQIAGRTVFLRLIGACQKHIEEVHYDHSNCTNFHAGVGV
jgi:hypothetical protein